MLHIKNHRTRSLNKIKSKPLHMINITLKKNRDQKTQATNRIESKDSNQKLSSNVKKIAQFCQDHKRISQNKSITTYIKLNGNKVSSIKKPNVKKLPIIHKTE